MFGLALFAKKVVWQGINNRSEFWINFKPKRVAKIKNHFNSISITNE